MTTRSRTKTGEALDAFERGCRALRNNRFAQAEGFFSRALTARPHWHNALQRRALTRQSLRNYRGAIADYRKALQSCPECHWCWGYLADTFLETGDHRNAKACLDSALLYVSKIKPTPEMRMDRAQYHLDRGRALVALGRPHAAIRDFNAARKNTGLSYLATLARGRALALAGHSIAAMRDLNTCVRMKPDDDEGRVVRGIARLLHKDCQGGMDDLKRVRLQNLRIAIRSLTRYGPASSPDDQTLKRHLRNPPLGR